MFWKGQLNVYTWLKLNLSDIQDLALAANELDDSFVDSHLVSIPGFGTFTTRGLPGGDPHSPGWHWSWPLDLDLGVVASAVDRFCSAANFSACFVDGFWALGGDGDPDVGFFDLLFGNFTFFVSHFLKNSWNLKKCKSKVRYFRETEEIIYNAYDLMKSNSTNKSFKN